MSRGEAVETFRVSLSTIKRYLKQEREHGEVRAPKPPTGRPPKVAPEQHGELEAQLRERDTATLAEHARMWEERRGVALSISAMSRAIGRLGWTREKGRWAPPKETRAPGPSGG
jgi:transposase